MRSQLKLIPKLTYNLRLTPQMKLSLNLLELPLLQLKEYLNEQIEKNPLLEYLEYEPAIPTVDEEDEKKLQYQKELITQAPTLQEYLLEQLHQNVKLKKEIEIGEFVIGNIDENGYFTGSVKEGALKFKVNPAEIERILSLIQTFDPAGIGARNLRECLLLQLKRTPKKASLEHKIINKHLLLLEKRKYEDIAKALSVKKVKISIEEIKEAIKEIAKLNPKPGLTFSNEKTKYIIPDAVIRKKENGYEVLLNEGEFPRITINKKYQMMLKEKNTAEETRNYLKERLSAAQTLLSALLKRKETIQKITEIIIHIQKDFLNKKEAGLLPLTLEQIARQAGRHKSTICRAISNKYIQTPHGIFQLRYFINPGVKQKDGEPLSSTAIKSKIAKLIKNENKRKPLTDRKINAILKQERITISRRVIAKYRKQLKIPSSKLRQK